MDFNVAKQTKLDQISGLLKPKFRKCRTANNYDCLTSELRAHFNLVETENVSENPYHIPATQLFDRHKNGLVLDFGAGKRNEYLPNVVNMEIVAYDSTDVICTGEVLPFRDGVFDAVHCNAVLEHVKDPFACAKEIARVLKPGGDLMCCVPFLQPYHGFPHHYYNMTQQGLSNLFAGTDVLGVEVYEELRPITTLKWILREYANGLGGDVRDAFLNMRVVDLLARDYEAQKYEPHVTQLALSLVRNLASANTLFARKPPLPDMANQLVINEAYYGVEGAWLNVTSEIQRLVKCDSLLVSCEADLHSLFHDPAPGVKKALKVRWFRGDVSGEIEASEFGGRLETPLWI